MPDGLLLERVPLPSLAALRCRHLLEQLLQKMPAQSHQLSPRLSIPRGLGLRAPLWRGLALDRHRLQEKRPTLPGGQVLQPPPSALHQPLRPGLLLELPQAALRQAALVKPPPCLCPLD